ncbi:hypothetical protein AB0A73_18315 [Glycomyces sp. NPDC047369]
MVTGTLVAESLRTGAEIDAVPLRLTRIRRGGVGSAAGGQPQVWTVLDFEADDAAAEPLAAALSAALDPESPWYVDFATAAERFVVFAGKVFRYPRSDAQGRAAAVAHALAIGVPEEQTDWPD